MVNPETGSIRSSSGVISKGCGAGKAMDLQSKDTRPSPGAHDGASVRSEDSSVTTSSGLAHWCELTKDGEALGPHVFAEMMARPRFADACQASLRFSVEHTGSNPVLTRVTIDTTRLVYGYLVLYLDAQGEITLKAIQNLCREIGLASHGRAQAILFHLRAIGYLLRDPASTDRRSRHYLPSPDMKDAMRDCLRDELRAFSLIEPEAARAAERLSEPEFFRAFLLRFGKGTVDALKFRNKRPIGHFTDSNAGLVMLWDVILSAEEGDSYPPRGPLKMSVRELARKYKVSRTHILRLFRSAEARGLLTRNAEEQTITLSEAFARDIVEFEVIVFLGMAKCAQYAFDSTARSGFLV
jgi:hypothetical protein